MEHASCRYTPEQWETYMPLVRELYYFMSLKSVQAHMSEVHRFHATERMYKSRMRMYNLQQKKLDKTIYNAMWVVYQALLIALNPVTIHFETIVGDKAKKHDKKKIHKELERKSTKGPRNWMQLSFDESVRLLLAAGDRNIETYVDGQRLDLAAVATSLQSKGLPQVVVEAGDPVLVPLNGTISQVSTSPGALIVDNSPYSSPDTSMPLQYRATGPGSMASGLCHRCPEYLKHASYDYDGDVGDLFEMVGAVRLSSADAQLTDKKSMVGLWALPSIIEILQKDIYAETDSEKLFNQDEAIKALRHALVAAPDNMYLLPTLQWMHCVLFYNCHGDALVRLLESACEVISAQQRPYNILLHPFHLILAWLRGNERAIHAAARQLQFALPIVRQTFGETNSNTMVFKFYHTWYLSYCQRGNAVDLVSKLLPEFKKRFGAHNTLTINCMALLAQEYLDQGNPAEAIRYLTNALDQLGQTAHHLTAYKLEIQRMLATAESRCGLLDLAERHFQEVLDGRMKLFRPARCNVTALDCLWESIHDLRDIWTRLGRQGEAEEMFNNYTMDYWKHREEWYRRRDYQLPPDNTNWIILQRQRLREGGRPNQD
jgi:tetratricopeptide (TPR) repeat protein